MISPVASRRSVAAANEGAVTSTLDTFKDPLWMVAFAMGILFALMAALIAAG